MDEVCLRYQKRREDIARVLPKGAVGAEIGVYRGEFSKPLAKRTRPKHLYLIDPWWLRHGETYSYRPSVTTRSTYDATVARMQWWIERQLVSVVVQTSQHALAAMPDDHLDWAYLDSSHDYLETKEELRLLVKKVKPRGIICGHDFNTDRHPGVFRALSELLSDSATCRLFYLDNFTQWALRRSAS